VAPPLKTESAAAEAPLGAVAAQDSDVPDWLRELRGGPDIPPPSSSTAVEVQPVAAEQLPAWLSDLRIESVDTRGPIEVTAKTESPLGSGDNPASPEGPKGSSAMALAEAPATAVADEVPDWLKGLSQGQPSVSVPSQPVLETGPAMTQATSEALPVAEGAPSPELLVAGEIPAWVLELRPGALSSVSGQILETSGLLAGIRGALPVESVVSLPHKPSAVPPVKASMPVAGFAELHVPKPVPPQTPPSPPAGPPAGCFGRIGLPLLILFVITLAFLPLPNVSDWRGAAIAAYQPSRDFYQTINHVNALQPDALALVAIDYGAASRAELDPQAKAVLSHLFQNKQRIVTMSFVPEGGQLAQDLLLSRNPANSQFTYPYAYGETHINLGFQAGGEAALRKLSGVPLQGLPIDFRDQQPAANWHITKNWKTLDDVALIVIFSDDGAQVVRWIEQVGTRPEQSTRTLLAGVSKSSEPFLMPYYESRQLKGLLAGTHGAAEYEGFLLQPASAAATLDGISYVVIVLVVVIVLSMLATAMKRRSS